MILAGSAARAKMLTEFFFYSRIIAPSLSKMSLATTVQKAMMATISARYATCWIDSRRRSPGLTVTQMDDGNPPCAHDLMSLNSASPHGHGFVVAVCVLSGQIGGARGASSSSPEQSKKISELNARPWQTRVASNRKRSADQTPKAIDNLSWDARFLAERSKVV